MIFEPAARERAEAFNRSKPWEHEPDYRMFEAAGLTCCVRRVPEIGHLCGYVGVGRSHALYGVNRTDLVPAPGSWLERPFDIDEHGVIDTFMTVINLQAGEVPEGFAPLNALIGVHGGLTWSAPLHDHTGWWFGFDCGHAGDFSPGQAVMFEAIGHDAGFMYGFGRYRTFDFVMSECATLAQQIADWSEKIPHIEAARAAIAAARETRHNRDGNE